MRASIVSRPLWLALAGVIALAGCSREPERNTPAAGETGAPLPATEVAPPSAQTATSAPSELSVSSVTVGTSADADKRVMGATTISAKDPIIVSVRTTGSASNVAMSARLIYQDGQTAGEQGATLTTNGEETTNVEFRNPAGWPAGRYRAEVMVDGKAAGTPQQFEVK